MIGAMGTSGARINSFANDAGMALWTYIFNKSASGSGQIVSWRDGVSLTPTTVSTTDVGGTFSSSNLNVGARSNGAGFPSGATVRQLVVYTGDVSAIRTNVETIMAA